MLLSELRQLILYYVFYVFLRRLSSFRQNSNGYTNCEKIIRVGDSVVIKGGESRNRVGVVSNIYGTGNKRSFDVAFDCGVHSTLPRRLLEKINNSADANGNISLSTSCTEQNSFRTDEISENEDLSHSDSSSEDSSYDDLNDMLRYDYFNQNCIFVLLS